MTRPVSNSEPVPASDLAKQVLSRVGMETTFWRVLTGKRAVLCTVLAAVLTYVVYVLGVAPVNEKDDPIAKALVTTAAALAFVLTYAQWHLGREETSYDRYYDRVRLANDHIDKAGQEGARLRGAAPPTTPQAPLAGVSSELLDHHRNMIVFTELDTLEYVLGKRRLDYIDDDLVERAVRTFHGRCAEHWFVDKVRYWSARPELGYRPRTMIAARFLAGLEA